MPKTECRELMSSRYCSTCVVFQIGKNARNLDLHAEKLKTQHFLNFYQTRLALSTALVAKQMPVYYAKR